LIELKTMEKYKTTKLKLVI